MKTTMAYHKFLNDLNEMNKNKCTQNEYNFDDTIIILKRLFYTHRLLMNCLAGWLIDIPEYELKMELSYHLYIHAESSAILKKRLLELRVSDKQICAPIDNLTIFFEEVKSAENSHAFIYSVFQVIIPELINAYLNYMDKTNNLLDKPTCRIIEHIMLDLNHINEYGSTLIMLYIKHKMLSKNILSWNNHIKKVLQAIGGIAKLEQITEVMPKLRYHSAPFQRKLDCKRDIRFKTFSHTRDYMRADTHANAINDDFTRELFAMARTQRDEIDAVETFANVLYDFDNKITFEFQLDLARFIWDEARHAAIGQQMLTIMGYNPFDVPCGLIGINVRTSLSPAISFAQINIFGESNQPLYLRKLIEHSKEQTDDLTLIINSLEYIYSDESMHIKRGRKWIKEILVNKTFDEIKAEAREASLQGLFKQGVHNEDYILELNDRELGELIGE